MIEAINDIIVRKTYYSFCCSSRWLITYLNDIFHDHDDVCFVVFLLLLFFFFFLSYTSSYLTYISFLHNIV